MPPKPSPPNFTVAQIVELCIEWAKLAYPEEIGWSSGHNMDSESYMGMNSIDADTFSRTYLFLL
jgi:hypothetical protein